MIKDLKINQYGLIEKKILKRLDSAILISSLYKSNAMYSDTDTEITIQEFLSTHKLDISIEKNYMNYRLDFIGGKYVVFKIPFASELSIENYKQELRQILLNTSKTFFNRLDEFLMRIYYLFKETCEILNNNTNFRYFKNKLKTRYSRVFSNNTAIYPIIYFRENEISLNIIDIQYMFQIELISDLKIKYIKELLSTEDVNKFIQLENELHEVPIIDTISNETINYCEEVEITVKHNDTLLKFFNEQLNKLRELNLIDMIDYQQYISKRFLDETKTEVIFVQDTNIESNHTFYQIGVRDLPNKIFVNITNDTTGIEVEQEVMLINLYDLFVLDEERKHFFMKFLQILNEFELDTTQNVSSYIDIDNKKFNPYGLQEDLLNDLNRFYWEFTEYLSKTQLLPLINLNQALELVHEESDYYYISIFDVYEEEDNSIVILEYQSDFSINKEAKQLKYVNGQYRKEGNNV